MDFRSVAAARGVVRVAAEGRDGSTVAGGVEPDVTARSRTPTNEGRPETAARVAAGAKAQGGAARERLEPATGKGWGSFKTRV